MADRSARLDAEPQVRVQVERGPVPAAGRRDPRGGVQLRQFTAARQRGPARRDRRPREGGDASRDAPAADALRAEIRMADLDDARVGDGGDGGQHREYGTAVLVLERQDEARTPETAEPPQRLRRGQRAQLGHAEVHRLRLQRLLEAAAEAVR
jgi:hypothetical protein